MNEEIRYPDAWRICEDAWSKYREAIPEAELPAIKREMLPWLDSLTAWMASELSTFQAIPDTETTRPLKSLLNRSFGVFLHQLISAKVERVMMLRRLRALEGDRDRQTDDVRSGEFPLWAPLHRERSSSQLLGRERVVELVSELVFERGKCWRGVCINKVVRKLFSDLLLNVCR